MGSAAAVLDELAHGLGERVGEGLGALLVRLDDGLGRRAWKGLLHGQALVRLEHGDDGRRARLHGLAELVVEPLLDLVVGDLSEDGPARRADHGGGQQGRRSEPDEEADAPAPLGARAADAVARLLDGHVAGLVVRHEDDRVDAHLLGLDLRDEPIELRARHVDALVGSDQDVGQLAGHVVSSCAASTGRPSFGCVAGRPPMSSVARAMPQLATSSQTPDAP